METKQQVLENVEPVSLAQAKSDILAAEYIFSTEISDITKSTTYLKQHQGEVWKCIIHEYPDGEFVVVHHLRDNIDFKYSFFKSPMPADEWEEWTDSVLKR